MKTKAEQDRDAADAATLGTGNPNVTRDAQNAPRTGTPSDLGTDSTVDRARQKSVRDGRAGTPSEIVTSHGFPQTDPQALGTPGDFVAAASDLTPAQRQARTELGEVEVDVVDADGRVLGRRWAKADTGAQFYQDNSNPRGLAPSDHPGRHVRSRAGQPNRMIVEEEAGRINTTTTRTPSGKVVEITDGTPDGKFSGTDSTGNILDDGNEGPAHPPQQIIR